MAEQYATRLAFGEALAQYGSRENTVVLDADLACCTMSMYFRNKYLDRFFNIGIAEGNMMGIAAGLATTGKNVFACSFAMFAAGRAFEQVRNSIAYPHLNVKVVGTHSGIAVGEDGATHQCLEDLSLMRTLPGMTVICPADAAETRAAVKALVDFEGPAYLRIGRIPADIVCENLPFTIGKANEMREGCDATIIACGLMVQEALKASDLLKESHIHARVLDMHTIKPIDRESILKAAHETGCIITAEEHNIIGGLGSAVAEVLSEVEHHPRLIRIGMEDRFGKSGKPAELFQKFGLNAANIADRVKAALTAG